MKRIVQNLLAVFLLAVLLVPVTALGAEAECEHVMPEKAEWTWTPPSPLESGYASYKVTAKCTKCGHPFTGEDDKVPSRGGAHCKLHSDRNSEIYDRAHLERENVY